MPKIPYIEKRFQNSSLDIIEQANEIVEEYSDQGFNLTLRQLYYQFVARDLIPNSQKSYNRMGSIINDARLAGHMDWEAIEDRTRNLESNPHWESPKDILLMSSKAFAYDKWDDQDYYVEVWIEKEALVGVIEPVCRKWDVPFFACRGYSSQSEQWRAGERLSKADDSGKTAVVLHLGDHDPSGIDMTRDNFDRLNLFASLYGCQVLVERLALNMDQVEEYGPPENPAKVTDSRFQSYQQKFGGSSWELDALEPSVISDLIETEILARLDRKKWDAMVERERKVKLQIKGLAGRFKS